MSLLRTRQQLAVKRILLERLTDTLTSLELEQLFISETRLEDVLELAAGLAAQGLAAETDCNPEQVPVPDILAGGVRHCRAKLQRGELLSQPEQLLLSVAEHLASSDSGTDSLRTLCSDMRTLQREQRRARMNMGKNI